MVYKKGPLYKVRPVEEVCEDIREAGKAYGEKVKSVFFPAGNTIAMPTEELAAILRKVKKGTTASEQIKAGRMAKEAGIELSEYVILGLGGTERSEAHAKETAKAINAIEPDFLRLRTLVAKINTLLLHEINKGRFKLLSPHQVLQETKLLIENTRCRTFLTSDHYSNYLDLAGRLPEDKERLLVKIDQALSWDESRFRPCFIGSQ